MMGEPSWLNDIGILLAGLLLFGGGALLVVWVTRAPSTDVPQEEKEDG